MSRNLKNIVAFFIGFWLGTGIAYSFIHIESAPEPLLGGPESVLNRTILPERSRDELGTSTRPWARLTTTEVCLSGDCQTAWPAGGAGGGLATTSPWTNGNVAYVTGLGTVGSVATGTLTESVTGLQFDQTRALLGGAAVLSLTSGYNIPLTASTTNWNTAYGWGDHGTEGYLTEVATTTVRNMLSASSPLSYNAGTGALSFLYNTNNTWTGTNAIASNLLNVTGLANGCVEMASGYLTSTGVACGSGSGGITSLNALTGSSQTFATGTATGIGLTVTSSGSTHTFTPTVTSGYNIPLTASTTEWVAAYASTTALTPTYIRGLFSNTATGLTYTGATGVTALTSGYNIPLSASTTNWNGFYDVPSTRITAGTGIGWAGNTLNVSVVDTNTTYTAGNALTLTGTEFNFDGGASPGGELGGTWASPTIDDGLAVTNWNITTPTLTSFFGTPCTGNQFLQDIGDTGTFSCAEAASGGGGLATSSPWTNGNLAYVTGQGSVGSVATGTLTTSATGLELNATRALVGGAAILALTSGYSIPLTASTTQWAAAFASTTAMTPTYTRGLFSNTTTGLTYTAATGVTSLTANYNIPLTASTTNWNTFYDTPSNRITAGNGLAWTGNTLSATSTHAAVTIAGQDFLSLSTQQITANAINPDNLAATDFGSFTCNGTTCTVDTGAISNTMLANSTVSYGGISLSLGGTDATPAFNLADATGLPIATGVSGLGTNVATFLATPSSANLRSALTDEAGSGPAVFASSTMLTSPTLVSFFGTPCAGNQFLQDISDTGTFTCADATGGGGGDSAWATTTLLDGSTVAQYPINSAVDLLLGGNSTATAGFWFDRSATTTRLGNGGAGDSVIEMAINSVSKWIFGADDSTTNDDFVVSLGGVLGTTNALVIDGSSRIINAVTGLITTGSVDFGGASTFEIPNGTNPTVSTLGQMALDTTGDQLLIADSGGTARVVQIEDQLIWSRTIASTSPAFISGGLMPLPTRLDGFTITRIQCHVMSGTSKVIAIEDASANSSEDITCATTNTTDDGSITNATYTASELAYIDFGATSGAVDYVSISVFGNWTRE